ncbi:MAG TPA: alpha/beta hydrolase [Stellaceae bacterium]|nr:alpha/beta hydrolase [Stellaceae bacterium]
MSLYRGMDRAALDKGYSNSAAVPDVAAIIRGWDERSVALRAKREHRDGIAYGPAPRNTIDWFPAGRKAPVIVFIHGGYWQSNATPLTHFVGEAALDRGIAVAHLEYTLAPEATMSGIVAEIGAGLDFLAANLADMGGDPGRIYLTGHSAGGHLTAAHWAHPAIQGALPISGLFELEPIALGRLNDPLRLTAEEIDRHSPIRHIPRTTTPIRLIVGGDELPELRRQTADYAAACRVAGQPVIELPSPGYNHFTVLDELALPRGRVLGAVLDLLG